MNNFLKVNIDRIMEKIAFTYLMSAMQDLFIITQVRKILLLRFPLSSFKIKPEIQRCQYKLVENPSWNCIFLDANLSEDEMTRNS